MDYYNLFDSRHTFGIILLLSAILWFLFIELIFEATIP